MGSRYASEYFGYPVRESLYPGEQAYFSANPHVAGMASLDGRIIFNPSAPSEIDLNSVGMNEAARLWMRENKFDVPFTVTPAQEQFFAGTEYGRDPQAMRHSILARILSGDPSAQDATSLQKAYADYILRNLKKNRRNGTR